MLKISLILYRADCLMFNFTSVRQLDLGLVPESSVKLHWKWNDRTTPNTSQPLWLKNIEFFQ